MHLAGALSSATRVDAWCSRGQPRVAQCTARAASGRPVSNNPAGESSGSLSSRETMARSEGRMAMPEARRTLSLVLRRDQSLVGVPMEDGDGELVRYFSDDDGSQTPTQDRIQRAPSLAGA